MYIIEDSRQQKDKHELKHRCFEEAGTYLVRCKLPVGDYCSMPKISVDTKQGIEEIAKNIGDRRDHERFIREIKAARDWGTMLYILVENEEGIEDIDDLAGWINPRTEFSPRCIQGARLAKAMHTIEERYGCVFLFCRPDEAADTIIDLLRESK